MRNYLLFALGLALLGGGTQAQPGDGDLIVGQFRDPTVINSYGPGSILSVDPTNGAVLTIAQNLTMAGTLAVGPNWIEMASDNTNFMVGMLPSGSSPAATGNGVYLHTVAATGAILRTLVADTTPPNSLDYVNAFDLDYDGTWVMGGGYCLWAFDENTLSYSTLMSGPTTMGQINALCINRAQGGPRIVAGLFNAATSANPFMTGFDRSGQPTTVITQGAGGPAYISAVRLDWYTGDYICTGFGDLLGGGGELMHVSRKGLVTTLNTTTSLFKANGLYIDQRRMAYVLTYDWQTTPIPPLADNYICAIYKMDLQGTFVSMYTYSPQLTRNRCAAAGITEYGSRHVVCNGSGKPGTTVAIRFSSRKASDAGKSYVLAASLGHVGGVRMPNGEFLNLSVDGLFLATAQNVLPTIFRKFVGLLDGSGNAAAAVALPAGLPPGLGLTVFVSGVVIDPNVPGAISTVGNTHWFVLN